MKKKTLKLFHQISCLIILLFISSIAPGFITLFAMDTTTIDSSDPNVVIIIGDSLEYISSLKVIKGKGHISVEQNLKKITSDEIEYYLDTYNINAAGNVEFKDEGTTFKGDNIIYNTKTLTGTFDNATIFSKPWFFITQKFEKIDKKAFKTEDNIIMTTCDLKPPHYNFEAKKMYVYLDDKIIAYHVFFHIGKVPIMYSPIYYYSLKYSPFYFIPSYDSKNGWWFNSKLHFTTPPYTYGSFILDWWQKRGWGKGLEYNYYVDDNRRGTFYLYNIDQKPIYFDTSRGRFYNPSGVDPIERSKSHYSLTHTFNNSNITAKLNYKKLSDPDFEIDYEKSPERYLKEDVNMTVAKSAPTHTISVFTQEIKNWDESKKDYVEESKTFPELKVDFLNRPIFEINGKAIYHKLDILYANRFEKIYNNPYTLVADTDYYYQKALLSQALMTSFNPFPRTSLTPTIKYIQNWYSNHDPFDHRDRNYGIYITQLGLTINLTRNLRTEFNHEYNKQLDELYGTGYEEFKGVAVNNLKGLIVLENTKQDAKLSIETNYDFRKINDEPKRDYRSRFGDLKTTLLLSSENTYKLTSDFYRDIYADEYDPYTTEYQNSHKPKNRLSDTYAEFTHQFNSETKLDLNSRYYYIFDGELQSAPYSRYYYIFVNKFMPPHKSSYASFNAALQFKLTKNWSVLYKEFFRNSKIHQTFYLNEFLHNFKREEQSIELKRDLHCWEASFIMSQRLSPYEDVLTQEYTIKFSIKALPDKDFLKIKPSMSPYSTYYK
ncbi:LPS-assembly protein LptD [Candidatus Poribacteria bacterium]|nr:LPS-assembly protein LptD [Candidatus Poribacteria bacterium]